MRLRLTTRAHRDLVGIASYIEQENPLAVGNVVGRIEASLNIIAQMPMIGRKSVRPGTREFPVHGLPLLIVYRATSEAVEVLTIFHTSRDPKDK
jgi:plasmid stabilization system protein ParE